VKRNEFATTKAIDFFHVTLWIKYNVTLIGHSTKPGEKESTDPGISMRQSGDLVSGITLIQGERMTIDD
jgi:hypothetical protein